MKILLLLSSFLYVLTTGPLLAAEAGPDQTTPSRPAIGEIFGQPVTEEALAFAQKTVSLFSGGDTSPSNMGRRAEAWRHLTLLGEAERRGLVVPEEEKKAELERLLKEKKLTYGSYQYFRWVEGTVGDSADDFEKRLENMLKVQKLISELVSAPGPDGKPRGAAAAQKELREIVARAKLREYGAEKVLAVQTTEGDFELTLDARIAPKAVENMVRLAEKGYYDGILFHRVDKTFVIQGGDPTGTGRGGKSIWGEDFEDEINPDVNFDRKGLLAMANSGPNTNSSQFFITLRPTPELFGRHTLFGHVSQGMDVVEKIGQVPTDGEERPLTPVKILKMRLKA